MGWTDSSTAMDAMDAMDAMGAMGAMDAMDATDAMDAMDAMDATDATVGVARLGAGRASALPCGSGPRVVVCRASKYSRRCCAVSLWPSKNGIAGWVTGGSGRLASG
jgi:hypothetical protein